MYAAHMTTGKELKELREEAGLTQAQVAAIMRTHASYLPVIEAKAVVRKRMADRYREAVEALTHTQSLRTA